MSPDTGPFAVGACDACGDDVHITTTAEQQEGYEWTAFDGDEGRCEGCNALHIVSLEDSEDDLAYLMLVEPSEPPSRDLFVGVGTKLSEVSDPSFGYSALFPPR